MRFLHIFAAGFLAAAPALADGLPLPRGYYVDAGTPCAQASNFSTYLLTRDSLRMGREQCRFGTIQHEETRLFIVQERCGGQAPYHYGWVIDADKKGFHRTGPELSETRVRFCAQKSMPEPWRSNDIRALVK